MKQVSRETPLPDGKERESLFARCRTPEPVRQHGQAVAQMALRLAERCGAVVDGELLQCACLLHDLARTEGRKHAEAGAAVLNAAGYPALADAVAQHHDLQPGAGTEAELLYLADKLVRGTQSISLEERFAASREKCKTPEALEVWERRRDQALALARKYNVTDPA